MNRKLNIGWLTSCPSGDQVDFFKELAKEKEIDFTVLYCSSIPAKGRISVEEPSRRGILLKGIGIPIFGVKVFINPGIVSHLLQKRYDLIVIGGYSNPTMLLAMIVRSFQGRPWLFFGERAGMNCNSLTSRIYRSGIPFVLKRASAIIATGTLAYNAYKNVCPAPIPVYSIPYLIDLDPFLRLERTVAPRKVLRFLYCGQLIPRKGVDTLAKVFISLARIHSQIELFIVGDGQEKDKLKSMIPSWLKDRVVFTGVVPFEARAACFQAADVYVHPARYDGWGVVIQEAMAAGLPVVATNETGAAFDLVEDGINGFLLDADDCEVLYQRMKWFADNPMEVYVFGQRARERVSSYTPQWGADQFMEIAKGIVNFSMRT